MIEISRARRWTGQAALAAVGVGLVTYGALPTGWRGTSHFLIASGVVVAAASVGLGRKNLVAQMLARGVALLTLLFASVDVAGALAHRLLPSAESASVFGGSVVALMLTRPLLRTRDALAAFAPARFRDTFLTGATLTSMTAVALTMVSALSVMWREPFGQALGFSVLAAGQLAALIGLLRLRTWAVLLGLVNAAAALGIAFALADFPAAFAMALAAVPGLFVAAPIVLARLVPRENVTTRPRADASRAPRVRIALRAPEEAQECPLADDEPERDRGHARVLGHDGRSHAV